MHNPKLPNIQTVLLLTVYALKYPWTPHKCPINVQIPSSLLPHGPYASFIILD